MKRLMIAVLAVTGVALASLPSADRGACAKLPFHTEAAR